MLFLLLFLEEKTGHLFRKKECSDFYGNYVYVVANREWKKNFLFSFSGVKHTEEDNTELTNQIARIVKTEIINLFEMI